MKNVEEEIKEYLEINHSRRKNGTMKLKQLRRKNGRMMEMKQAMRKSGRMIGYMTSISHKHLGVIQPNKAKKKKSRRLIDTKNIPGFLSSASEQNISNDTHLFIIWFGMVDSRAYLPQYHRPVDALLLHGHCLHGATRTYF
ncbi:hypothetical protein H5410_002622 [Solanum commersonii]|uniref:Uncharacterized protein n=1 Tax=Solanum commersonii TaxID=4109 RepID=A0A9J6B2G3_SOLCO|nr:hypothetical protein H5410_002622 [Solanum commersonii]